MLLLLRCRLNYVKARWAAASGFGTAPVDPKEAQEVLVLCCAIKPMCGWNTEDSTTASRERCGGQVGAGWEVAAVGKTTKIKTRRTAPLPAASAAGARRARVALFRRSQTLRVRPKTSAIGKAKKAIKL